MRFCWNHLLVMDSSDKKPGSHIDIYKSSFSVWIFKMTPLQCPPWWRKFQKVLKKNLEMIMMAMKKEEENCMNLLESLNKIWLCCRLVSQSPVNHSGLYQGFLRYGIDQQEQYQHRETVRSVGLKEENDGYILKKSFGAWKRAECWLGWEDMSIVYRNRKKSEWPSKPIDVLVKIIPRWAKVKLMKQKRTLKRKRTASKVFSWMMP